MRIVHSIAILLLLLSSCGQAARLDTSSDEAFESSLQDVTAALSHADRQDLAILMAQLANREKVKDAAQVLQGKPVKVLSRSETFRPLNGMSGEEIIAYCKVHSKAASPVAPPAAAVVPSGATASDAAASTPAAPK